MVIQFIKKGETSILQGNHKQKDMVRLNQR